MELLISAKSREKGILNSARCSLNGALTLGRGPESPLALDGTGISREHLRIHSDGDGIFITDLSSNGTWLNARRLTQGEPHSVTPADAIQIPGFEIRIDMPAAIGVQGQSQQPSSPAAGPLRTSGPLGSARNLVGALSTLDKFIIALALATVALIMLYFSS